MTTGDHDGANDIAARSPPSIADITDSSTAMIVEIPVLVSSRGEGAIRNLLKAPKKSAKAKKKPKATKNKFGQSK
jgi:hypothetical protein